VRFILIDALTALEPGARAEAEKTFDPAESFFADHFPGTPIVPGVLLTEAMSQTAGWLVAATRDFDCWPLLTMVADAKFRRPVRPGERIQLGAELRAAHPRDFEVMTRADVDGQRVASARLLFHAFDVATANRARLDMWMRETYARLGGPALLALPEAG
jgi:3-hydroxyacyl-[acyl-carrier-protein] dehydratase